MISRIALVLAAITLAAPAPAQQYPVKPVRLIVAFAPGGPLDIHARIVGQKLSESWGQQVVIDNRTGASGTIGADLVAKAPADGYTVLANASVHVIVPSLIAKLHADIARVLNLPEVRNRFIELGGEPVGNAPAEFDAFQRAELARWTKVIRDSGAKAE